MEELKAVLKVSCGITSEAVQQHLDRSLYDQWSESSRRRDSGIQKCLRGQVTIGKSESDFQVCTTTQGSSGPHHIAESEEKQ